MVNAPEYTKKSVTITALEWSGWNKTIILDFVNEGKDEKIATHNEEDNTIEIKTLEGIMKASVGDYIIKGVKGEFYPCKPDIFKDTYFIKGGFEEIKKKYIVEDQLPYNGGKYQQIKKEIIDNLPKGAMGALDCLEYSKRSIVIAGGFFRHFFLKDTKAHDMDIYFHCGSNHPAYKLLCSLYDNDEHWIFTGSTENCRNYKNIDTGFEVDLVSSYDAEEPIKLLEKFDYTVTKFAVVLTPGNSPKVVYHKDFFRDLYTKTLNYDFNETEEKQFSGVKQLARVLKYNAYGFKLSKDTLQKFVKIIQQEDIEDIVRYCEGDESYAFLDREDEDFDIGNDDELPF